MYSCKWLIVALVACGMASACSQYNTNLSTQTASSTLNFVSPATSTVGSQGFTITANGTGYTPGALILWNGTALVTTYVSATQLTAPVPASDLATAGTVQVAVQIPGSASSATSNIYNTTTTEISNIVIFTVGATPGPAPTVSSLSASTTSVNSTPYCSAQGFTLTVTGTNFTSDSIINWNGAARPTNFVSATQLTTSIPAALAAFPGTANVTVANSLGSSSSLPFTLATPAAALPTPTIASLSQTSAGAGSPALTLTVQGNVLPCSVVKWVNGGVTTSLATNYVAPAGGGAPYLTAVVPAADLAGAGTAQTAQIFIFNLGPGGGQSPTSISFTISPPTIVSLSSSTTSMGSTPSCSSSGFTLTVNGTNFLQSSQVNWNGSTRATTFVSPTQLTAAISAADIASAGPASITVSNSSVSSGPASFTISAPSSLQVPAIASISPAMATAGAGAFTLSVMGTNFVPCSVVQWNGVNRATTVASSTQLQATISASDVASVGTDQVTVFTPTSSGGGGTSSAISFSIVAPTITSLSASTTQLPSTPYCSSAGLTLTVNGTNFVNGLVVNWNGSPRQTTYVSPTQLTAAITPADTAFPGTVAITVSDSTTTSSPENFSMTPPAAPLPVPTISLLSPSSAVVGGVAFTLTVNGTNFLPCSTVQWNGGSLSQTPTVFVPPSGITTVIPAADIMSVGTDQVTVVNPAPGGGTSAGSPFIVHNPGPAAARTGAFAQSAGSAADRLQGLLSSPSLSLPLMSSDSRYVVNVLSSTDGVTEIPGTTQNIFVRDTCLGAPFGCTPSNTLVSIGFNNNPADGDSISPSISADGRYVSFLSSAMNLVDSDTNGVTDVFVRDTCLGVSSGCTPSTKRVSVANDGAQANGAATSATIGATGRYITFESQATNLGAVSSSTGLFLRDTCAGAAPGSGCTPSTVPFFQ